MVSTHLKNISQIGNLPQIGVKIWKNWNHHLDKLSRKPGQAPNDDRNSLQPHRTFRCNTAFRLSGDARGLYEIADLEEDRSHSTFKAGLGWIWST